ncbi:hypothetical protein MNBD_PLANCTO02-2446 [hydrothermal vent metagenome]|uniref:Tll0287-like domain-containing protein n=1 Tax=hydrothermal vent metagenome TaxID=652676 RepID=A0A3B1DX76_9ZZZZ
MPISEKKMKINSWKVSILPLVLFAIITAGVGLCDDSTAKSETKKEIKKKNKKSRVTLTEAKEQAKLLHEAFHTTLQVVHRQYFRQDEKLQIPSRTLDTIFEKLSDNREIQFKWISVNAQAMNIDHEPETKFEKKAAQVIASGKDSYEQVEKGVYRHAGKILLLNQCLKCHLPDRTSTKTRFAGLIISMKLK